MRLRSRATPRSTRSPTIWRARRCCVAVLLQTSETCRHACWAGVLGGLSASLPVHACHLLPQLGAACALPQAASCAATSWAASITKWPVILPCLIQVNWPPLPSGGKLRDYQPDGPLTPTS